MKLNLSIITLLLTVNAPCYSLEVAKTEGETITFKEIAGTKAPPPLKTDHRDITVLGFMTSKDGKFDFVLLKGIPLVPCNNCTAAPTIGFYRIDGGYKTQFVFPGRVWDRNKGITLYKSQAFFGKCLDPEKDVYLAFQEDKVDRRRRNEHSVFIAEIEQDHLEEKIISKRAPSLKTVLRNVKLKRCFEIPGIVRASTTFEMSPASSPALKDQTKE
jgi:hypothetical protein